jgi:hypothetical protein
MIKRPYVVEIVSKNGACARTATAMPLSLTVGPMARHAGSGAVALRRGRGNGAVITDDQVALSE